MTFMRLYCIMEIAEWNAGRIIPTGLQEKNRK